MPRQFSPNPKRLKKNRIHCVYAITNFVNGNRYIGSAVDFVARKRGHINSLNDGKHHNRHLQKAWLKYGEESFGFSILTKVDQPEMLLDCEQSWLDGYSPEYNIEKCARSSLGRKITEETRAKFRARPRTPETIAKITASRKALHLKLSDAHKAALRASFPWNGRHHTEESKIKIAAVKTKHKITAGDRYNSLTAVQRVNSGRQWEVRCDCGVTKAVNTGRLVSGRVQSCGCHKIKDGIK